jgi:predicted RNase H-like nuclease
MKIAGIDSCPLGWIVIIHDSKKFGFEAVKSIEELVKLHPDLERIFIDIPIGLTSKAFERTVESLLRKELHKRASTIFTPACREAIYASNYDKAREINKKTTGKSVSIQSYNISKKIKEVDLFLESKQENLEVYESHPEICFKYLNNEEVIQSKKSTAEGFQERFQTLINCYPELEQVYESIQNSFSKSKVKPDDVLDAMVLCVSNLNSEDNPRFFQDENNIDEKGIFVRIGY